MAQLYNINPSQPLVDKAENIYDFAKENKSDQKWLFDQVESTATLLLKTGYAHWRDLFNLLPEANEPYTPHDYYLRAMADICRGSSLDDPGWHTAEQDLSQAVSLVQKLEKQYSSDPRKRWSVAYKWMKYNIDTLKYWAQSYEEKKIPLN